MKIVISKIVSSVTEFELDLNAANWKRIKNELELVQEDGRCCDLDISSQKNFLEGFVGNEELYVELFDILASNNLGTEESYLDVSNENYEGRIVG